MDDLIFHYDFSPEFDDPIEQINYECTGFFVFDQASDELEFCHSLDERDDFLELLEYCRRYTELRHGKITLTLNPEKKKANIEFEIKHFVFPSRSRPLFNLINRNKCRMGFFPLTDNLIKTKISFVFQ